MNKINKLKSQKNTLIRNATLNWVAIIINIVVFFFLTPFVIASLGETVFGIWVLIMSISTFMNLMDFGMSGAVKRYIAHYEALNDINNIKVVASNTALIYTIMAFLVILVSVPIYFYLFPTFSLPPDLIDNAKFTFLVISIDIALTIFFNLYSGALFALQRFDLHVYGQIGVLFLRSITFLFLLLSGFGIKAMAVTILTVNITFHIYKIIVIRRIFPIFKFSISLISIVKLKELFSFSLYGFATSLANLAEKQAPTIIIGLFFQLSAVAYFSIAQSLVNYISQIVGAVSGITGPAVSRLNSLGETANIRRLLLDGQRFIGLFSVWCCGGVIFFGKAFLELWVGESFAEKANVPIIMLALATALSLPQSIAHSVMFNIGKHKESMYFNVGLLLGTILLQLSLVHHWGVLGVVLPILIVNSFIYLFLLPSYLCKTMNISLLLYLNQVYLIPIISAVPFFCLSYWLRCSYLDSIHISYAIFIVATVLVSITFFISVFLIALSREEKKSIKTLFFELRFLQFLS